MKKKSGWAWWRQRILYGILVFVIVCGTAHSLRVRHYEVLLTDLGKDLVHQTNEADPRPVPEEGPQADVEIEVHVAMEYLVFGELSGKIRLLVTPHEHAPIDESFVIAYICVFQNGAWKDVESYHEH